MINNRLLSHTAGKSGRDGFTLVELLVVIGIIAILAGVALGPITSGIKKAQQSAAVQTCRTLTIAEFAFANDHDGNYPDTQMPSSNTATGAAAIAVPLIAGSYTSDPTIYYISGGKAVKFTGSGAIGVTNISYDFLGASGGGGINSNYPDQTPIVWSSVANGTEPLFTTAQGTAMTAIPFKSGPFGLSGVACGYKSNSSKFCIYDTSLTTPLCTLVDKSWAGGVPTGAAPLLGGG